MTRSHVRLALGVMAVAALAPDGLLVRSWATPTAHATGIHHPVSRAA